MDYDRIYRQHVKDLGDTLQMSPRQTLPVAIVTDSQGNISERLSRYWVDLNQSTVFFYYQIFELHQPDLEQRFFRFAALFAFFPPDFFGHVLVLHGSWLWHFAPFIHIPEFAPLVYNANRYLQELFPNFPLLINASMFFHLVDLDYYYEVFIPQIYPILNENLADTIIIRVFSNVTLYSIAKSLRIQYIHAICDGSVLNTIGKYKIEYAHFGLECYHCVAVAAPLPLDQLVTFIKKKLEPLFPIINLNVFNRMIFCYIILPPAHLDKFVDFFRILQSTGYLESFQIAPVSITQYIQFDADLPSHISISRLLEFNSLQIYSFRNPEKWRHHLQQLYVKKQSPDYISYQLSAIQVAFLYNLYILHSSDQSSISNRFIYDQYTQSVQKSAVSYEDFLQMLTQLRNNDTLSIDRYAMVYALKSFPYFITCYIAFSCPQPYMMDLLSQFNLILNDAQWSVGTYFSSFFFSFWLAQIYWNCNYIIPVQLFPISKSTDYYKFAIRYEDLQKGQVLKPPHLSPITLLHPLYTDLIHGDPITTPEFVRSTKAVLQDLLVIRPYISLYEALYTKIHVRSHKLDALFRDFFNGYFNPDAPLHYLEKGCWQSLTSAISEILNGNRPHIKDFLSAAFPLQRLLPAVLQTKRIFVILTSYSNLHPDYLVHDPFLQGIFQWGVLSCRYQTTNFMSIILLEYDLPQAIYDNPKSNFHRFWSDCRLRYENRVKIVIEPILVVRYSSNPHAFASHQLLIHSFSLKNLIACEYCVNPSEITYNYQDSSNIIDFPQSNLQQYLLHASEENQPLETLHHFPLWWREWLSPEFFLMTLGSLWGIFLIQKTEVWEKYHRHIINFCQQFPAMTLTETSSFILLELQLTGIIRETASFVISQFADILLPFELILPVDGRMYSSKHLQTLLRMSRHEYAIRLSTGEWVEEPIFHGKNSQSLYSLEERIRIHILLRQLIRTYLQQVTFSVWRQCMQYIDTTFSTNPPRDNDLLLYQQLEDLILHPPNET